MSVDFDIYGKGVCSVEVQLNNKDSEEFKKTKNKIKEINLEETSHLHYSIPRAKFPKRIRIIISNFWTDNPIEIKNVTLRDGKYKLDDLKQFKVNTGKLAVKEGYISIIPPPS